MEKFKNKYRIPSARLQSWDYRWAGAYFVTICTHNRECYFGEIVNGKMQLSLIGIIADVLWYELKNRIKNIDLGEFVVMPDHIHGILILKNTKNDCADDNVETLHATSLQSPSLPPSPSSDKNELMSAMSPKPNSISTIIRSYKSAVTKHAHRLNFEFRWQPRFFDHIIRNEKSFNEISEYIINNPANWENDKFS